MTQELKVIDGFTGKYARFSNFYPVDIMFNSIQFPTVEHAFVANKSKSFKFWYIISKLRADQAGKAKRLGRKTKLREDWELIKIPRMRHFLDQKFNYDEFQEFLLSTGNATLIEGNYWHDNFWGDCHCDDCKNIVGQNNLGKLLMKKRDSL